MNTIIVVCAVVATIAFVILVSFAVRTLMQIYNTARQAEIFLKTANLEMDGLSRITASISKFVCNSFPVIKIASAAAGMVSGWFAKRKKTAQE